MDREGPGRAPVATGQVQSDLLFDRSLPAEEAKGSLAKACTFQLRGQTTVEDLADDVFCLQTILRIARE